MYDRLIVKPTLYGQWMKVEEVAKDLARFKHAIVNASWDIKPKELPMSLRMVNP
jgi:hypothetical protein